MFLALIDFCARRYINQHNPARGTRPSNPARMYVVLEVPVLCPAEGEDVVEGGLVELAEVADAVAVRLEAVVDPVAKVGDAVAVRLEAVVESVAKVEDAGGTRTGMIKVLLNVVAESDSAAEDVDGGDEEKVDISEADVVTVKAGAQTVLCGLTSTPNLYRCASANGSCEKLKTVELSKMNTVGLTVNYLSTCDVTIAKYC